MRRIGLWRSRRIFPSSNQPSGVELNTRDVILQAVGNLAVGETNFVSLIAAG
jgi:hypothetical protein